MRSVWQSLREWSVAVGRAWFAWAIAGLTGLIEGAKAVFPGFDVPRIVLVAGYAAAFVVANIKAFHEMRLRGVVRAAGDRDAAIPAAVGVPDMSDSAGLALLKEPVLELDQHDVESRAILRQLGMTNPLVSRFQISNYAPPLAHDERGCVIRVVFAAVNPPQDAELKSQIKSDFKVAVERSALDTWFIDQTLNSEETRSEIAWVRDSPNNGYVTTLKRPSMVTVGEGSRLCGTATLQLPPGAQFGPWLIVILDVIERAPEVSAVPVEGVSALTRLRFTLGDLHGFLHVLARSAIDEVGTSVFPTVFGDATPDLLGPNYEINFGDRSLNDLLLLPRDFERTPGGHDIPWAYINTPDESDPRDLVARDTVIRNGLESMLRQNEYDGIEDAIAALVVPASHAADA